MWFVAWGIAGKRGREMRIKARGESETGRETPTSSAKRWAAIARRSASLLGGTAALALSITQPARAISINDPVANAVNGITKDQRAKPVPQATRGLCSRLEKSGLGELQSWQKP
jgi:hypothetical protein